jgi:hypothetical protein
MQIAYDALRAKGLDTGAALRVLRQLVMERLVVLDCDMAPTLLTSCNSLPPEGAELARGGPSLRSPRLMPDVFRFRRQTSAAAQGGAARG